jgi:DNA-binding NarL/FixJ family response regulator
MSNTLYLVDDHAVLRNGLCALLQPAGYEVVGEGWEFHTVLTDLMRLRPALVLLDLSLGDRSGIELLAEIQRRKLRSRVLVLTMHAQPRQVTDAVRMGAMGYLLKGASGGDVISALGTVLAGRHAWSAEIAGIAINALSSKDAQEAEPDLLRTLSLRERQVLSLIVRGRSSAAVAEALQLSVRTVETYRSRLMQKLGIDDITGLVRLAIRERILEAEDR